MSTTPPPGIDPGTGRAALLGHVVEALYHAWQAGRDTHLDDLVAAVRAARPHTPTAQIHAAIGRLECAGLIEADDETGRWRRRERPGPLLAGCPGSGCHRPDGHRGGHLPTPTKTDLHAELVVHHEEFMAAWSPFGEHVDIYADPSDWAAGNAPQESIPVPPGTPYTPRELVAILSEHYSTTDPAGGTP